MKILFKPEGGDTGTAPGTPPAGDPAKDSTPADQQTPEQKAEAARVAAAAWTPPASKELYEKAISDAVEAAKPKVPDSYKDLKLPDNAKVKDAKLIERTAATARTLGLSNENAQKALEFIAQEVSSQREAAAKEIETSFAPGGEGWKAQVEKWNQDALTDPTIGNGKPEVLAQKRVLAEKAAARFGDQTFVELLKNDPMGSHPAVVKFLAQVGAAIGEPTLIKPTPDAGSGPKEIDPKKFFDHPTSRAAMEKQGA